MALDDPLLRSAVALAATSADGLDALHSLVLTKFIVERIAKLPSLTDAKKAFEAIGEGQFSNAVVLIDEKKARTLLKKLDKHYPEIATVGAGTAQKAIAALAARRQEPHAPPRRKPRRRPPRCLRFLMFERCIKRAAWTPCTRPSALCPPKNSSA